MSSANNLGRVDIINIIFIHKDSASLAGGMGLYVKNSIKFNECSNLNINTDEVENLWIEITTTGKPLIIGVVYRHPVYKTCAIEHFSNELSSIFHTLNLNEREFYLIGDMNVNLCQDNKSYETSRYIDNLIGCSVKCIINKPTRITPTSKTLLDHIYTNNTLSNCTLSGGISLCDFSDHYGTFVLIPVSKPKLMNDNEIYIRDLSHFQLESFLVDLSSQMNLLNISDSENINDLFDIFIDKFAKTVTNHAPLRKATRKESRLKSKPWLFPGLLKCIKRKNRMFKLLHKNLTQYFGKCIENIVIR